MQRVLAPRQGDESEKKKTWVEKGEETSMLPDLRQEAVAVSERVLQNTVSQEIQKTPETIWSGTGKVSVLYHCWNIGINLLFGILGTVLLLLLLPWLVPGIYLESPGPIFYTQERLGRYGRPFRIYKFRSMHVDAEPEGKPVWATKGDKRITRMGYILRRIHLDELPQVLNILQGDMALIGPRPEREVFAARLEQLCPAYRYRLTVKPGLTGWAQVKYGYGEHSSELQKLHYDLEYIQRRTIRFDILILLKTVTEILTLRGR
jgi:lipopolysaccharide/colanic/teichoic acid biosynthesis glycosyltransferase